ncbi:MAG: hypothetical protein KKA32_08330 [Actinobacteria bacterium]|nr:hypothetical protein [Actinomycetota bacterium]
MGDRIDRVVRGMERLFHELSVGVREERILRYIVTELSKGRRFDQVMADPYIINNTDAEDRAHILESPEVLRGIEDQMAAEFTHYQRQLAHTEEDEA